MPRSTGEYSRHIVVLTDGQVTDAQRIFQLAERESQRKDRRRISVICIDSAPNEPLVTGLAEKSGGEAFFLTSSPEEADLITALEEVLGGMARPLRQDLFLCAKDGRIRDASGLKRPGKAGGRDGIELGALPMGRPVWVAGWIEGTEKPGLVLVGSDGEPIAESDPADNPAEAVKGLCGALRISRLERLLETRLPVREIEEALSSMGLESEEQDKPLYPENSELLLSERVREALAKESLATGIVSTETAFVAVRSEAGQKVAETLEVPNMRPRGWDGAFDTNASAPLPMTYEAPVKQTPQPTRLPFFKELRRVMQAQKSEANMCRMKKLQLVLIPHSRLAVVPRGLSFSGKPSFDKAGVAVLFRIDETGSFLRYRSWMLLRGLEVSIDPALAAELAPVADKILLRLFVRDLITPLVEVNLKALLEEDGGRSLNTKVYRGEALECRLIAPDIAGVREKLEFSLKIFGSLS